MILRRLRSLCISLYALLIYGFIFLPVVVLVLFSFQDSRLPIMPFKGPTLKWYEAILGDDRLVDSMVNSLMVAMCSSLLAVILGFLAAYALARFHLPAKGLQRAMLTAPLTVSYLSSHLAYSSCSMHWVSHARFGRSELATLLSTPPCALQLSIARWVITKSILSVPLAIWVPTNGRRYY